MPSHFGWVDFAEHDRQQMLDLIHQFRDPGARDELGLGTIRDAFADHFFPGTSTIQTRARYFLFIPWTYRALERRKTSSAQFAERARTEEIRLIDHLLASPDHDGTIGAEAKQKLQRLPSSVYWSGLGAWGIRLYPGSEDQYRHHLDHYYRQQTNILKGEDKEPIDTLLPDNWHPGLPEPPKDWPKGSSFTLTPDETNYLRERILDRHSGRLLAHLFDRDDWTDADFLWQLPWLHTLPATLQDEIQHARRFSEAMYGAALLYNLLLARLQGYDDWIATYKERFTDWAGLVQAQQDDFAHWHQHLGQFWSCGALHEARIPPRTKSFVEAWLDLALTRPNPATLADDPNAFDLLANRELKLKGTARAKLTNERAREQWLGAAGADQLRFRWPVAQRLAWDIYTGLHGEEDAADA